MANYVFQLTFKSINSAVQVGDIVYYIPVTDGSSFYNFAEYSSDYDNSNVVKVGAVIFIDKVNNTINVQGDLNIKPPSASDFIFFTKDNLVNLSNIKGYYAEIKMVSTEHNRKSELFSVNLAADESSK